MSTHGILVDKRLHKDENAFYGLFLTSDLGKIDVIIRGARRNFHRWGASFQPLEGGEMVLYPVGDRYVLTAYEVDTLPPPFVRNKPSLRMALALVVSGSVMKGSEAYPEWDVLVSFLHSKLRGKTAIAKFLLEYISVLGYRVFMSGASCGVCGRKYEMGKQWFYTPYEGYLVCDGCHILHGTRLGDYPISEETIREIVRLKKIGWEITEDFIGEDAYRLIVDRASAVVPMNEPVKYALYKVGGENV